MEPEPEKLESVPPETEISDSVKSEESPERTKVSDAILPILSKALLEIMPIVGKPFSSLSPTIPGDCLLVRISVGNPVSVVIAAALMATVVFPSSVLRAAASTEASEMVMV